MHCVPILDCQEKSISSKCTLIRFFSAVVSPLLNKHFCLNKKSNEFCHIPLFCITVLRTQCGLRTKMLQKHLLEILTANPW